MLFRKAGLWSFMMPSSMTIAAKTLSVLMSLNMLIETAGGFDYTGKDCQAWMREAGFSKTRVEPLVGPDSMVIGLK